MEQTEHGQNRSRNRVHKRDSRTNGLGRQRWGIEKTDRDRDRQNKQAGGDGVMESEDADRETKQETQIEHC